MPLSLITSLRSPDESSGNLSVHCTTSTVSFNISRVVHTAETGWASSTSGRRLRRGVDAQCPSRPYQVRRKSDRSNRRQARTLDFRVLLRLRVRTHAACVTTRRSRCSHDLFPLRGLPALPLDSRPPLMRFQSTPRLRLTTRLECCAAALQGIDPTELGVDSEELTRPL